MSLNDLIIYICRNFPWPRELSLERVMQIIFLYEWHTSLKEKPILTNGVWKNDVHGPTSTIVEHAIRNHEGLKLATYEINGKKVEQIVTVGETNATPNNNINNDELIFIIMTLHNLGINLLPAIVYSTYPMLVTNKGHEMNLRQIAGEYRAKKANTSKT